MPISILGAGLSGLSAAINLSKGGKNVIVYENKDSVGEHLHPCHQALMRTDGNYRKYLNGLNLNPIFDVKHFFKSYFCTRKRDINIRLTESVPFVSRGGKKSLEFGLFKEAESLGVTFEFRTKINEKEVDIVASGRKRFDIVAYSTIYENANFERDHFLYMYDDRVSPKGLYLYAIPFDKNKIEIVNCVSQPHTKKGKKLFLKAVEEREILKDILKDANQISEFGGSGGIEIPRSAVLDNRIYVGEAAGFQDPFMGFGMNYALESGKFAADSILYKKDYDILWKKSFKRQLRRDISRRFVMSILGDRLPEYLVRKVNKGDVVNLNSYNPSGKHGEMLISVSYWLEICKRKMIGRW